MAITAPQRVVGRSDDALRRWRDVRDRIQEDAARDRLDAEFNRLIEAVRGLRDAMRADLGTPG
ncbi:hypothetical protein GCM10010358_58050 [Streptomyces minutiscleroticus]|uniref:Uncharacterized protein n=1 Tax=Streptomyces minutiscleroticus TaxID=68238 RepID=A0A918NUE4_9ACTN|nr:hypothetical protein [Streptomyces minutiscleroticus]GGX96609.1 hypothetical protein GCM10010358_58050 [Streptomyces minutiscleroticus]